MSVSEPVVEIDPCTLVELAIPLMQSAIKTEGLRVVNDEDVERMAVASVRAVAVMLEAATAIVREKMEEDA